MNVVVVEDDEFAARRLERMIYEIDPGIQIVAKLESVVESVGWFKNHAHPDLIFLDIHLEDDLSFAIFDKVEVDSPIIFTTAFDEYAIRAFKLKSIDYLLKPIVQEELNNAIAKYNAWNRQKNGIDMSALFDLINKKEVSFRERFSVSFGQKIKSFGVSEIAYFYSKEGMTYAVLIDQKHYPVKSGWENKLKQIHQFHSWLLIRSWLFIIFQEQEILKM